MLNFHGIWACFLFDIKKLLRSSRFYMTILVVCFVIWDHLAPISTWLAAQHYKITPWVYPFISNSVFLQMVIVGGTLFLFSDAPFFDETQLLLIVRMNRVQWCMAQMIYICVSTMVYFAAIAFVSIFLFIPNITFSSRWGAVILALSRGETDLENVMSFSKYITESMSPIGANALCLLFSWMASVCLAEIQFFFNLDEKKTNRKYNCWFLNFTRSFFTHDIIGKFRKVFNHCVNPTEYPYKKWNDIWNQLV